LNIIEAIQDLADRKPHLFAPQIKQGIALPKREHEELAAIQKELGIFRKS
jgi:hypothetical protein